MENEEVLRERINQISEGYRENLTPEVLAAISIVSRNYIPPESLLPHVTQTLYHTIAQLETITGCDFGNISQQISVKITEYLENRDANLD